MSSNKDICKIVAFKCLKKQLDLWFYMLLSRVLTLSQILKKLQQRQKWHNVHFLRFLQEICILCDLAPWDYKSQVWNNSSDVTTDKTHYVMTVWLVFWSKRVCNALLRPSPVIGGRSGGDRDAIHTVTLYHQNDFNIYKESPSCLFDSRHHMNALRLSVTSRETKTKCFHRERTVKLEEEEKKKEGQTHPVVAPHSSGITSEERDIIFASLTMDFCRRKRRSALRLRESERFIHEVRGVDIKQRRLIVMFHPRE